MNKNILAAFGIGALLAGGGAYLLTSNSTPAPLEITSKTTEQALKAEPIAAPIVEEEPAPAPPPAPAPAPRRAERTPAKSPAKRVIAQAAPPAEQPMRIDVPASTNTQPVFVPQDPPKSVIHGDAKPAPAPVEIRKPDPIAEETRRKQREPARVTIPAGTQIIVRMQETLAADKMQTGDTFHATLDSPLEVGGFVLAEKGARAVGRVVESDRAGRVKGVSKLSIELTQFTTSDGQTVTIQSEAFNREGDTSKKADAAKVGAGAAVGAALGAIFGGGKGAAIGGAAGAGAGGGTVLMTRGKPAVIEVETRIPFATKGDVTVTEKIK
jgi:uncharacterized protein YcfJ